MQYCPQRPQAHIADAAKATTTASTSAQIRIKRRRPDAKGTLGGPSMRAEFLCRGKSEEQAEKFGSPPSNQESQERFIDIAEVLSEIDGDGVYEATSEAETETEWQHEARFARQPGDIKPIEKVKGALDPDQADILSAYSTEQGFREVDVHYAAYHMQDSPDIQILDVRSAAEFQTGHIDGSRNISLDDLSQAVREGVVNDKKPLAVICARGGRSAQACVRLSKVFGFENVTNIAGGMNAWIGAGFPVTQ